jgi:hypothetical protein
MMASSKVGGDSFWRFHNRTVASRDAEMRVDGLGNETQRTWTETSVCRFLGDRIVAYVVVVAAQRGGEFERLVHAWRLTFGVRDVVSGLADELRAFGRRGICSI